MHRKSLTLDKAKKLKKGTKLRCILSGSGIIEGKIYTFMGLDRNSSNDYLIITAERGAGNGNLLKRFADLKKKIG